LASVGAGVLVVWPAIRFRSAHRCGHRRMDHRYDRTGPRTKAG